MIRTILFVLSMALSSAAMAQSQNRIPPTSNKGGTATVNAPESQAAANKKVSKKWRDATQNVYYPDYYTFYDAQSHMYIFQDSTHHWISTAERPFFMQEVDLGNANVQILKDRSLAMPEDRYEQYLRLYPAQSTVPSVPVPVLTVQPKKK